MRGWVGPTAFTLYSNIEAYKLIKDKFKNNERDQILMHLKKHPNISLKETKKEMT